MILAAGSEVPRDLPVPGVSSRVSMLPGIPDSAEQGKFSRGV